MSDVSTPTEIKILKLVNGAEIIAKIGKDIGGMYLENPFYVITQSDGQRIAIGLQPFSMVAKINKVRVKDAHVLCTLDPEDELANQYSAGLAGITLAGPGGSQRVPGNGRGLTLVE